MARRGRGAAAPRPDVTPDGAGGATNGEDEPGARTIGALAVARWAARKTGDTPEGADHGAAATTRGPYDEGDLDPEQTEIDKVDFGAVRIPVPRGGQVSVEPEEGRLQAVHVMLPTGRLSVSALAAPRTDRLWPDLAVEIDESLREGGATVRSFTGEWGRELHARTGEASSVFVGVDGPRWMLYGVATGPTSSGQELDAALRRMLRGTVVIRGHLPYPVRTVLPLTVPEHLADAPAAADEVPAARGAEPPRRTAPDRPGPDRPGTAGPGAGPAPASAGPRNGGVPLRPGVGGPPADPRRPVPVADAAETPTEPYGLPRVAAHLDRPDRADRNGRPPVNGTSTGVPGRDVPATGRPAAPPVTGRPAAPPLSGRPTALPAAEGPAGPPPGTGAVRWALTAESGTPGAGQNGAAQNGAAQNGATVRGPDRDQALPRADRSSTPASSNPAAGGTGQRRVADLLATVKPGERNAGPIGQRRVADLLAAAERERRAAQEARASAPAVRPAAPEREVPRNGVSGAAPRNGASGASPAASRNGPSGAEAFPAEAGPAAAHPGAWPGSEPVGPVSPLQPTPSAAGLAPPFPSRPAEQPVRRPVAEHLTSLPARYGEVAGAAPQRLGAVPRTRGDGHPGYDVPADGPQWSAGTVGWTPDVSPPAGAAAVQADGSEDWTVPMPVVPPTSAAQPEPSRDLWEGDPWAAETRRAAQAARDAEARAAEARAGRNGTSAPSRPVERPDQARSQRPNAQRPDAQRPNHQAPGHHRPAHERPGDGRHGNGGGNGSHGVDRHGNDRHGVDRPRADRRGGSHGAGWPGVDGPRGEPAVDVPAARVPPPLPALAYLVDERTDPFDEMSGRHRRPER